MVPHNYCLHVSSLHAKAIIITNTSAKRRLTWGNGNDAGHGPVDVGLHVEQVLPNKLGGQMLIMNFLSRLGCDTWPTVGLTWHSLHGTARTLDEGLAKQSSLKDDRPAP